MEAISALLDLCVGNSPVTGEFPSQRPVMWNFAVFFDLRQNKRLSKQSRRWWFETPWRSLWRQCNVNRSSGYCGDVWNHRTEANNVESESVFTAHSRTVKLYWKFHNFVGEAIIYVCRRHSGIWRHVEWRKIHSLIYNLSSTYGINTIVDHVYVSACTAKVNTLLAEKNGRYSRLLLTLRLLVYYGDIIMTVMASQITGDSFVCWIVCSGADQRKHQSSATLVFVRGPVAGGFPSQRASNADTVSIWWRQHEVNIGSGNIVSPVRHQAITWTNTDQDDWRHNSSVETIN